MTGEPVKKNIKVMLVDDDSFLLDMYSLKFKNAGYEVEAVNDPGSALDKLRDGYEPDIVLFDIVMPGAGGWGFIKQIREEKLIPKAKAIVLSNQGQQSDFDESKEHKVDGYIVKALTTPSEVLEKVEGIYSSKK
ncbi:response regulator [Candidatus Pacebacteria bacterium]|nr:response regulator [Candidatus Paceibacterota bacterium]